MPVVEDGGRELDVDALAAPFHRGQVDNRETTVFGVLLERAGLVQVVLGVLAPSGEGLGDALADVGDVGLVRGAVQVAVDGQEAEDPSSLFLDPT